MLVMKENSDITLLNKIINQWVLSVIQRLQKEGRLEELLKEVEDDKRETKRISTKMA